MPRPLSADDVLALRTRAQLLAGRRPADVGSAVSAVVAVQAQAAAPARLAVRARTTGLVAADVDRATNQDRTVVRTWLMRGTLHMVAAADLRWMLRLLGPLNAAAGRRRREQLGLDEDTCRRGLAAIESVLTGSPPLTRAALVERIADAGVRIDPRTQAPAHLVAYAAALGLVCRGPDLARDEPTYVRVDDWVPAGVPVEPDAALAELTRRYVAGYGPATERDFAAWAGLPARAAARGFALVADELRGVDTTAGPAHVLTGTSLRPRAGREVRLLGHFDAYLLGYRGRELALDRRYSGRIQAGGGIVRPAVVVDGRVVGTWQLDRIRHALRVVVQPFDRLPADHRDGLAAEAADVGRFLGADASLVIADQGVATEARPATGWIS